jgi:DNA-binding GntR family transcriptional regulator
MAKSTRVDRAEEAYQHIRAAIVSGALPDGHRLNEDEIAGELGLSRTPIREALLRLAGEDLVETRGRQGTSVRAMTRQDAVDLAELFFYLLNQATRRGLERLAETDYAALAEDERTLTTIDPDPKHRDAYVPLFEPLVRSYAPIHRASASPELLRALERVAPRFERLLHSRYVEHAHAATARLAAHRAFLDAVQSRQFDAALAIVEATQREFVAALEGTRSQPQRTAAKA